MSVIVGLLVLTSPHCGQNAIFNQMWNVHHLVTSGKTTQSAARCMCARQQVRASRTDNTRSANRGTATEWNWALFLPNTRDSSCTGACSDLLVYQLHCSDEEMAEIEVAITHVTTCIFFSLFYFIICWLRLTTSNKRRCYVMASNTNWHKARVGLLTASNFKRVCHCNDGVQSITRFKCKT